MPPKTVTAGDSRHTTAEAEARAIFKSIDRNGDSVLSYGELATYLCDFGYNDEVSHRLHTPASAGRLIECHSAARRRSRRSWSSATGTTTTKSRSKSFTAAERAPVNPNTLTHVHARTCPPSLLRKRTRAALVGVQRVEAGCRRGPGADAGAAQGRAGRCAH